MYSPIFKQHGYLPKNASKQKERLLFITLKVHYFNFTCKTYKSSVRKRSYKKSGSSPDIAIYGFK